MSSTTKTKSIQAFKCAGLIGKYGDPGVGGTLRELSGYLQQRRIEVLLDEGTAQLLPGHGLETGSRDEIGKRCDLVIVVGGDGTLLNAARSLVSFGIPLLGVLPYRPILSNPTLGMVLEGLGGTLLHEGP
ncbi:MAG: NAD(+)/NADH kinase, partial [Gammaproteobacteria bacterium]